MKRISIEEYDKFLIWHKKKYKHKKRYLIERVHIVDTKTKEVIAYEATKGRDVVCFVMDLNKYYEFIKEI